MPRLLLALAFASLSGFSQQSPAIPSPYQIAESFAASRTPDVTALMTRLGLPAKLDDTAEYSDLACGESTCRAKVIDGGQTVVLITGDRLFRLIWMEQNPRSRAWSVRGYLDGSSHYGVQARFISDYLLVETTGLSGFPSSSMVETLYEPHDGKLVSVLEFPSRGHEEAPPPIPSRAWTVTHAERRDFTDQPQEIVFYARLRAMPRDMSFAYADERRVATFIRPKDAPAFVLDPQRSDITRRHLDDLFSVHDGTRSDPTLFLSFARSSLLRLARGTDRIKREWLRAYLAQAPASSIKSELLRALAPSYK